MADRDRSWQEAYDDYCLENFGGRQPEGHEHDEACEAADEAVEEEEEDEQ